jgi:hypothetical protein
MKTIKKFVDFLIEIGEARARHLRSHPSLMRWY